MLPWSRCTYGDDPVDATLSASYRGLDTKRSDDSETTTQFDAAGRRERGDRLEGLDEFELVDVDQLPPGGGPDRLDFRHGDAVDFRDGEISPPQVRVEVIRLACELPAGSELPRARRSSSELAAELVARGVCEQISGSRSGAGSQKTRSSLGSTAFELAPTTGTVIGDDGPEHGGQRGCVDLLAPTNGRGPCGLVVVASGDDSVGVRHDGAVVEKHVDVVLRRQQRADVALQHEVRELRALDRLLDRWIGSVHQRADLAADGLLPLGQRIDVGVNAWVGGGGDGRFTIA
jgi:hypothetical protein